MNTINAILLGIIEGLTEFIPVSSTGHLILAQDILPLATANPKTFTIAIQLGAILAVVLLYKEKILPLLNPRNWTSPLAIKLLLTTTPALILGALTHSFIKANLFTPRTVAIGLVLGALAMLLTDQITKKKSTTPCHSREGGNPLDTITPKTALYIGLFQCTALWPGISRSAATIVGGILLNLSPKTAAEYSFLAAIPIITAATLYDLTKSAPTLTSQDLYLILIGLITSFLVAILAIKTFLKLLTKLGLTPFALYRLLLATSIYLLYL